MYTRDEAGHTDKPKLVAVTDDDNPELSDPTFPELLAEVQRSAHSGVWEPVLQKHEFKNTQFVAWINDMKHNRKGDITLSLLVPFRYRYFAYPLGDAIGLPLSFDVQRWQRYEQYREALARDASDGGGTA